MPTSFTGSRAVRTSTGRFATSNSASQRDLAMRPSPHGRSRRPLPESLIWSWLGVARAATKRHAAVAVAQQLQADPERRRAGGATVSNP